MKSFFEEIFRRSWKILEHGFLGKSNHIRSISLSSSLLKFGNSEQTNLIKLELCKFAAARSIYNMSYKAAINVQEIKETISEVGNDKNEDTDAQNFSNDNEAEIAGVSKSTDINNQCNFINVGDSTLKTESKSENATTVNSLCKVGSSAALDVHKIKETTPEEENDKHEDTAIAQNNDNESQPGTSKSINIANQNVDDVKTGAKSENFRKRKARRSEAQQNLHMTFKRAKVTSEDAMNETKYYFENGLRKVVPYDHKYDTFCKGRWVGKTLKEIYTTEFRLQPIEFYEKSAKEKRLLINLRPVKSLERVIKANDLLTSVVHRHECPVIDAKFKIIQDDADWFVIDKPCSIPIHPAGRFRYNSVISILAKEYNMSKIFSVHRIDRMTSGLLLFAKHQPLAQKIHEQIKKRTVEKEYVCRVVGDFSKFELPPNSNHRIVVEKKSVIISEPIKVFDPKVGTSIVSREPEAKECETVIRCLFSNKESSVLSCKPKTGRTHQIRVHLQYLGYPIMNDEIYNSPAWGKERYELGPVTKSLDDISHELSDRKKWNAIMNSVRKTMSTMSEQNNVVEEPPKQNRNTNFRVITLSCKPKYLCDMEMSSRSSSEPDPSAINLNTREKFEEEGFVPYRTDCEECEHPLPDPTPKDLVMYLHALKYQGPGWSFATELPEWAKPGFGKKKPQMLQNTIKNIV